MALRPAHVPRPRQFPGDGVESAGRCCQVADQSGHCNRRNSEGGDIAANAQVKSSQAALRTAELNLGFTKIISPINGIVGIAVAQVGDLVGPNSGILTTVSMVDPIKVYFTLNEREYRHGY